MDKALILGNNDEFCRELHQVMNQVAPVCTRMEPYEFRYSLNNITPGQGDWSGIQLESPAEVEQRIASVEFFDAIRIKPMAEGRVVLDEAITRLTQMLFVGLVTGAYPVEWVKKWFYFDPRGFNFLVRSVYLTNEVVTHLGGKPYLQFDPKQKAFELAHEVGYQEFMAANREVDQAFIDSVLKLVEARGTPILLGIAGPTAAGKTEIVERLRARFAEKQRSIAAIEMDNFLLDRDYREEHGIGSFGDRALHFDLLCSCIRDILAGKVIETPRYDFIEATSSHDLAGKLKRGGVPVTVAPADIIFIEGNSPFLLDGVAEHVGIKVVYLTDDPVRLKRKWRRDIDYRKKYDPYYLRNRYFKEQPPMAVKNYQPQLLRCDIFVDTTGAALWVTPQIGEVLARSD
jgi:uridine kinase